MHIISICTAAHAKSFNWFSCIFVADWQIFTSKKSLYKCSGVLFVLMYEVANVFKTDPKPQIFDLYSHPFSSFPDLIFHWLKENINVSTVWQEKVDSFAENRYCLQAGYAKWSGNDACALFDLFRCWKNNQELFQVIRHLSAVIKLIQHATCFRTVFLC